MQHRKLVMVSFLLKSLRNHETLKQTYRINIINILSLFTLATNKLNQLNI